MFDGGSMKNALRQRKSGAGLDVAGLIELLEGLQAGAAAPVVDDSEVVEEKKLDLAPEGAEIEMAEGDVENGHPEQAEGMELIAQMLGANGSKGKLSNKIADHWQRMKGK
jgi:hypothetical protein